jgi:hypothetical protein
VKSKLDVFTAYYVGAVRTYLLAKNGIVFYSHVVPPYKEAEEFLIEINGRRMWEFGMAKKLGTYTWVEKKGNFV